MRSVAFFRRGARGRTAGLLAACLPVLVPSSASGQDVEPRFIRNAPVGTQALGLAYAYSSGAVLLAKTIPVENVDARIHAFTAVYAGFFDFWGMSGRLDGAVQFATGRWEGELGGQDTATTRTGLGDPAARVALFFVGAPAHRAREFGSYRAKTVVGAAFRVRVPLGQYNPERAINLGTNRWSFSPRIGASQDIGRHWRVEGYGSAWFFTANTDFLDGNTLSQKPTFSLQLHLEYDIASGIWLALSTRQVWGGETSVNGVSRDDAQSNNRVGLTLNIPLSRHNVLRFSATTGLKTSTGNDYNSLYATWLYGWVPAPGPAD